MDTKKLLVDQYLFETEEECEIALSEKKKIQYIDEHTDYHVLENVAMLYKKMVDTCMFQTPVGYAYLERIRELLVRNGAEVGSLPSIPIKAKIIANDNTKITNENKKLRQNLESYKKKNKILWTMCIAFVIAIIALFALTFTSNNPNILNYENTILNKYSAWEQDLSKRENELREKELLLEIDE